MYAISTWTYINHKNQTNVGKYTIHGRYGKLLKTNIENKHIPKSSRNSWNLLGWGQAFHRPGKAALWPLTYIPSWSSLNPGGVQTITCLLEGNNMFTLLATPIHITQWLSEQVKLLQEAVVFNNKTGEVRCFDFNTSSFQSMSQWPVAIGIYRKAIHPKMARYDRSKSSHQGRSTSCFMFFSRVCKVQRHYSPSKVGWVGTRRVIDSSLTVRSGDGPKTMSFFAVQKCTKAGLWPGWRSDFKMTSWIISLIQSMQPWP